MGSSSSSLNNSPVSVDRMVNPESPTKDYSILEAPRNSTTIPMVSPTNNNLTPVKSRCSFSSSRKSYGSKDETFFDSQPWLQCDSDDDFHSVNGDFTPSLGNTPKTSFSDKPPRIHNLRFQDINQSKGSSSPTPQLRRKKLGELFRDSIKEESYEGSSAISTPYLSGEFNNDAIEGSSVKEEKKKKFSWQHRRCFPGFSSCGGSLMERRRKMSSETGFVAVK